MKKAYFLILMLCLSIDKLLAVPAYPYPVEITQPDGTKLTITLKGDEFASWAETSDGYTLLHNSSGYFEYAQKNVQGDLVLSGVLAKNVQQRNAADNVFLRQIPKKLGFSTSQAAVFRQLRQIQQQALDNMPALKNSPSQPGTTSQPAPAITGTIRAPLILVQFPEKLFTLTQNDFKLLCNEVGYSIGTATGSVHDYFLAASYNQLNFQVDVYGPYTLAHTIDYYDRNSPTGSQAHTLEIIVEAATFAAADGCNFANYDSNNDEMVDGVHLIFAGYEQSAGAPVGESIWATAWSTTGWWYTSSEGKKINRFSMSSELRNTSGTTITPIGVIAHELSHVFGLPDLYDTDYSGSGGQSVHLDQWDIMASGSWNNYGDTPPYHSAWCRNKIGWVQAIELDDPADVILPNPAIQGATYKITTTTPNEYFLLENRQKINWDFYIPASGLLIYHVDENAGTTNALGWRDININPSHRGLYVKQAGGNAASTTANRTTDPYPQGSKDSFTDTSIPNAKSWAGNNTEKPVTDIIHNTNERTISFKFMGGATLCPRPTEFHAENISASTAYIYWTAAGLETKWKLGYKKHSDLNFTEFTVTTMPYLLTELDANTDYDIRIQAICTSEESIARLSTFKTPRCDDMLTYTITSFDSFGDSWNGNSLTIKQNGIEVAVIANKDLDGFYYSSYGEYNTHTVSLCPCVPFEVVWNLGIGNTKPKECSFVVKNNLNQTIFTSQTGDKYENGEIVFRDTPNCITNTWTPQSSSPTAWNNAANWDKSVVPDKNTAVVIPQSAATYPILEDADNAQAYSILFEPGAELGRQDLLTYKKAFVQLDFSNPKSRGRWWMLTNPLKELYAGDFSFGGLPGMDMRAFVTETDQNDPYHEQGVWKSLSGYGHKLEAGDDFQIWLEPDHPTETTKGLRHLNANGIITLPHFEDPGAIDVHWTHDHDFVNHESTFYGWDANGYVRTNSSVTVPRTTSAYKLTGMVNGKFTATLDFGKGKDGKSWFAATGNPFMGSISFTQLQTNNSSLIGENYWVWVGAGVDNDSPGSYVVWNQAKDITTGNADVSLSDALAPMQSFIVEGKSSGLQQITFDIANISVTGQSGNSGLKAPSQSNDLLEIIASTPQSAVRAVIASHEDGSPVFNRKDSRKFSAGINSLPDIYMLKPAANNSMVAVTANILNEIKEEITVPLAISTTYEGTVTLSFAGMDTYNARIFFVDTDAQNKKENELTGQAHYEYVFNYVPKKVNGTVAANENRFFIRLSPANQTGIDLVTPNNILIYNRQANTIQVISGELIQQISVFNLQGGNIYSNASVNAYEHTITGLAPGVYVVKAASKQEVKTMKIIVK